MAHQFLPASDTPFVHSRCGPLVVLTSSEHASGVSVADLKAVKPGTLHLHRETTEIYVVREGYGFIRVDDTLHRVLPGDRLVIHPGALHQIFPLAECSGLVLTVVSAPAWREEDEIVADDSLVLAPSEDECRAFENAVLATSWPRPFDDR